MSSEGRKVLSASRGLSGSGLLSLVTKGMYDTPLALYREYIQNAADATAACDSSDRAKVEISVDVAARRIRITDNGPGLTYDEALERLLPLGRSNKSLGSDRGFRGVGRLAALAFADSVSFTTRSRGDSAVTRITWHSSRLPDVMSTELDLEEAVLDCIDVSTLPGSEYPEHFFEVQVSNVARHSSGVLLNRDEVRGYIAEICPVPLSSDFPFSERVNALFAGSEGPFALDVYLEGDAEPIVRPYGKRVRISSTRAAEFTDFQEVRIPSIDERGDAAVGWVAHSSYLGAIPRNHRIRGVRARVGNMQIGGEAVFDDLFAEERFNRWCIGEMHIMDSRIIPNARRDYFEAGPHLRSLENHLGPVVRGISTRCRRESSARNRHKRALAALGDVEDLYALADSGYLSPEDSAKLIERALAELEQIRPLLNNPSSNSIAIPPIEALEEQLNGYSAKPANGQFAGMDPAEAVVYQRIFGTLAALASTPRSALNIVEAVLDKASPGTKRYPDKPPDHEPGALKKWRLIADDERALRAD